MLEQITLIEGCINFCDRCKTLIINKDGIIFLILSVLNRPNEHYWRILHLFLHFSLVCKLKEPFTCAEACFLRKWCHFHWLGKRLFNAHISIMIRYFTIAHIEPLFHILLHLISLLKTTSTPFYIIIVKANPRWVQTKHILFMILRYNSKLRMFSSESITGLFVSGRFSQSRFVAE